MRAPRAGSSETSGGKHEYSVVVKSVVAMMDIPPAKDYAAAQLRQYQRLIRQVKPDLESYEKQKAEESETLYPMAHSLRHGTHEPSTDGVDRMVEDLEKQIEKRSKYSRRRRFHDDADIDYINERNASFNRKAARFYGAYTAEIRQNLERGTAV
uniref:pre-mRNA-splicing factor syf2-like n=1 Tax=Myxine glutinosa TaxID=7769 RepID=UPI00358E05A4